MEVKGNTMLAWWAYFTHPALFVEGYTGFEKCQQDGRKLGVLLMKMSNQLFLKSGNSLPN
jgi:hypothetical protein